jgi:hypothetical protein
MPSRETLRLAVLGDSVVWGQGLAREAVYATRAAARIAAIEGRSLEVVQFSARSGAKIEADPGEKELFVERHPTLAARTEEVEDAAGRLFGEVPNTFPTVAHQLETLIAAGDTVDLIVMGGGANDIDFKDVLDPRGSSDFVSLLDPEFEEHIHARMLRLLRRAREALPAAQIMVPGYYPGLTDDTDRDELRRLIRHGVDDRFGSVVGAAVYHGLRLVTFIVPFTSIGSLIDRSKAQATYGHSRGLYWLRRAVADINRLVPPGPGSPPVLFVHPAFSPENGIFADESFLHQQYELDALDDAKAEARVENCPRSRVVEDMSALNRLIGDGRRPDAIREQAGALAEAIDGPRTLLEVLGEIRDASPIDLTAPGRLHRTQQLLSKEIGRVKACRLASFFHPNAAGASRYAERFVERWQSVRRQPEVSPQFAAVDVILQAVGDEESVRAAEGLTPRQADGAAVELGDAGAGVFLQQTAPAGEEMTIQPAPVGEAEDDVAILPVPPMVWGGDEFGEIDCIAVRIRTLPQSAEQFFDYLELDLGTGRRWRLDYFPHESRVPARNFRPRHFRPGGSDLFTIDALDGLRREDIRYAELHRVEPDFGLPPTERQRAEAPWRPDRIDLELNGVSVARIEMRNKQVKRGRRVILPFPKSEPVAVPDVGGMTHAAAVEALEVVGLRGGRHGADYSDQVPRHRVLRQRPRAGTRAMRGERVALIASRGPLPIDADRTRVPNVVGMREEEAFAALRHVGFDNRLSYADSARPFGEVIGQSPAAGTRVKAGSEIALIASNASGHGAGPGDPGSPGRPGEDQREPL